MGNLLSTPSTGQGNTEPAENESTIMDTKDNSDDKSSYYDAKSTQDEARAKAKEKEMNEFKKQLSLKRELRREILTRHRTEKEQLERSLQKEKVTVIELFDSNKQLRDLLNANNIEIPENLMPDTNVLHNALAETLIQMKEQVMLLKTNNTQLRKDLAVTNNALQNANSDIADLNIQYVESMRQIQALKEVVSVSKTMVNLREEQLQQLKNKLNEIERTIADRETNLLSADLRQEYERQLQNIRTLRGLYEERARLAEVTRQGLIRELDENKMLYQVEVKKCNDLTTKVEDLETRISKLIETIDNKNYRISSYQDETNGLKAEMAVVNKLFSQVLLGYKTKEDLDTLVHRLEENHGILTQMAERENGSEISSELPKLLLELVSQVDGNEISQEDGTTNDKLSENETSENQNSETPKTATTAEDIVENLPKVWKVLIELLSHQNTGDLSPTAKVTTCYKSVNTASGPVLVPSVSQTYIRLKDLIVEKLGLVKEVNRMKQLNTHLETRLAEQERRLCLVTTELSKTWHVVGRLRRHHHQLHTHEKILKYELQQKRKLLNELKEELEYCRKSWEQAREKNIQTEKDWRKLRAEFSSRKAQSSSPSFNHSGESGYSDERPSDESSGSNDESEYVTEPLIRCKKKIRKSFEVVIDSSTDLNLTAEREDPVSDLLDVADLPLDTQDNEESQITISESDKDDHLCKHKKICEETEDEMVDITQDDTCHEEVYTEHTLNCLSTTDTTDTISAKESKVGPPAFFDEPSCSTQLEDRRNDSKTHHESQSAPKIEEQLSQILVSLTNKLSTRISTNDQYQNGSNQIETAHNSDISTTELPDDMMMVEHSQQPEDSTTQIVADNVDSNIPQQTGTELSSSDFTAILENVRKQNERLAKKDQRLQQLEAHCSEVVKDISSTLSSGDKIIEKLDTLHNKCQTLDSAEVADSNEVSPEVDTEEIIPSTSNDNEVIPEVDTEEMSPSTFNDNEVIPEVDREQISPSTSNDNEVIPEVDREEISPSTSNDINHEARFAARDLRLKILEEQTKSLVNKVNKTTSKGIKIHYKLEELHHIYGSENSRAGTPSEETEDVKTEDVKTEDVETADVKTADVKTEDVTTDVKTEDKVDDSTDEE